MVETITPVVHGGSWRRWAASLTLHVLGAGLSAGALGAALGGAGALLGAPWGPAGAVTVGIIALLYAAHALAGLPVPVPELRRQVPEQWRSDFSPNVASFLYGLGLGLGFATYLRFGTLVAVAAAATASGRPTTGALVLLPFGLARSLPLVLVGSARDEGRGRRIAHLLERLGSSHLPAAAHGALLATMGLFGIAASLRAPSGTSGAVAGLLLAVVFAWAGVVKLVRPTAWRAALQGYSLPPKVRLVTAWAVPVAELDVAAVLAFGSLRLGSALALAMLGAFSIAVLRARRFHGATLPCGCFGGVRARPVRHLLARNALLASLGVMAILAPPARVPIALPGAAQFLPALMTVAGVGLAALALREIAAIRERARSPAEEALLRSPVGPHRSTPDDSAAP
jgi:hypothetical protein